MLWTLLLLSIIIIISLAVNVTYANTQYGIFTACSVNNIGVYTSCTIWYNQDTPPAVPLKIKATMIQSTSNTMCENVNTVNTSVATVYVIF